MKSHHHPKQFNLRFAITGVAIALLTPSILISSSCDRLHAQMIPDNSLGEEASVVTPNVEIKGLRADRIDGGAIRDANLFHSFEQFNIGNGERVYFANPAGIANIFSRVTGSNLSEIFGTLGVNGSANLFFINPNGIIFGQNASLDVGGSFAASTADAIQFGDRGWFSATAPEQPPLLTVKPSAFFFNQIKAGRIENRSTARAGEDLLGEPLSGLRVPDGGSLLLVGGDIAIDGGGLHAPDGRMELAGVAGNGTVGLNVDGNNLNLSFPEALARADISLTNGAFVNTSGNGGGSIQVQGANVTMRDRSFVFANTSGSGNGSGVFVRASQLNLEGGSRITTDVQQTGSGQGGDLNISSGQLIVKDGAEVSASTFGDGDGGSLSVDTSESVQVIGTSADGQFLSGLYAQTEETGNAGDLSITTEQLIVKDGAQVLTITSSDGDGGSLSVDASESVQVIGESADGQFGSALSAQTQGKGNAGDLSITTGQLLIQDGAFVDDASIFGDGDGGSLSVNASESVQVIGRSADGQFGSALSAQTQGSGNAGDLSITTGKLLIQDGAQVDAITLGDGDGGSLSVDASESVQVIGESADGQFPSRLSAQTQGSGNAGDLSITTGQLFVKDGAFVSVRSLEPESSAGNLEINANSILLNNQGIITAETTGGREGNITLQIADNLTLRNNSTISALALGDGNGGNIDINAGFVIAFPNQNNDIIARAEQGRGGNINIATKGIFGIEERSSTPTNETNDIDASSEFGLEGEVTINQLDINPAEGLEELPTSIIDVARLVAQNLCLTGQEGAFIITGKGGLSPSPQDTLNTDAGWEDWRMVENSESKHQQSSQPRSLLEANNHDSHQIVEAQSWFIAPNGNIVLSAQPVKSVSKSSSFLPPNCQLLDKLQP